MGTGDKRDRKTGWIRACLQNALSSRGPQSGPRRSSQPLPRLRLGRSSTRSRAEGRRSLGELDSFRRRPPGYGREVVASLGEAPRDEILNSRPKGCAGRDHYPAESGNRIERFWAGHAVDHPQGFREERRAAPYRRMDARVWRPPAIRLCHRTRRLRCGACPLRSRNGRSGWPLPGPGRCQRRWLR